MSDHTPTEADRRRDLLDDLAVCDAATHGPWDLLDSRVERWWFTAPNGDSVPAGSVEWQILGGQPLGMSSDYGWALLHGKANRQQIHPRREDLLFIAVAREGWPAAIGRAMAAEEVLRSLEWSGGDGEDACPVCDRPARERVHASDCRLALAIGARRETS